MKYEYLDTSDAASEKAINTVLEILRTAKVKIEGGRIHISVLEPAMPNAIKALYKSGFHRTASSIYRTGYRTMMLRRFDVIVELDLPGVKFGSDVYVKKLQKRAMLSLRPMCLSKEGVAAKTNEDSLIDITYAGMLAMYKETEELNVWRNHMQFTLPENPQINALIALMDRCIGLHECGSAVDYDRYDVRWGELRSKAATSGARLVFVPSSGRYELEVKVDGFSWSRAGNEFSYPETAADLKLDVERQLAKSCEKSSYQLLPDFYKRMLVQFGDMSSPNYDESKHLV